MPKQPDPSRLEFELLALTITERSGREIAQLYERETKKSLSYGSLYTTLRRMREAGWMKVREDPRGDGRTRLFKVTGAGTAVFNSAKQSFARFGSIAEGA